MPFNVFNLPCPNKPFVMLNLNVLKSRDHVHCLFQSSVYSVCSQQIQPTALYKRDRSRHLKHNMEEAWTGAMADIEDAVHEAQIHVDCITDADRETEPAGSSRPLEPPQVPLEPSIQERTIVGLRQPPPPPRAERPQDRATQQWLGRHPYEPESLYPRQADGYHQEMEQARLAHLEAAERWEEQTRQQNLHHHSIPKGPPAVMTMSEH